MAKNDYEYRVLSAQDRKNTAENLLRDVERQIFQTKDQLASAEERGEPAPEQYQLQLEALIARADRLAGLIKDTEKEINGSNE